MLIGLNCNAVPRHAALCAALLSITILTSCGSGNPSTNEQTTDPTDIGVTSNGNPAVSIDSDLPDSINDPAPTAPLDDLGSPDSIDNPAPTAPLDDLGSPDSINGPAPTALIDEPGSPDSINEPAPAAPINEPDSPDSINKPAPAAPINEPDSPDSTNDPAPAAPIDDPANNPGGTVSASAIVPPGIMQNLAADGSMDVRPDLFSFPGAEGWGAETRGGAGGDVVIVNTTADISVNGDGLISLREALESRNEVKPGKRIIVFAVGGLFDLKPHPSNDNPSDIWPRIYMRGDDGSDNNVTVACQTAPPPGVNIRGGGIYLLNGVTDHIWRHCTKRNDDEFRRYSITGLQDSNRTFSIEDNGGRMIFDHMSLSWATDSNWQAYVSASAENPDLSRITVSHSIIAEGDGSNPSTPGTYDSAQGPSCLNNHATFVIDGCSFLSNFIAHNETRNAALWGASGEALNNIVYNYIDHGISFFDVLGLGQTSGWVRNNLIKEGPDGPGESPIKTRGTVQGDRNFWITSLSEVASNAFALDAINVGRPMLPQRGSIHEDIRVLADNADTAHMRCLGASRPLRDAHDATWINEFFTGSGQIFNGPNPETRDFGIYPLSQSTHGPLHDTDQDGIADAWEQRWIDAGYSTSLAAMNHLTDSDGDGYLDIEEYINEMARCN